MIARAAILVLLAATPGLAQQQPPPERGSFARWIAEGPREQIPWHVKIAEPQLHLDQRLYVDITVTLSESDLNRHGSQHDLLLLTRVGRPSGGWLPGASRLAHRLDEPLAARTNLVFSVQALLTPGEYQIGLVLFDRMTGHRSVKLEPLRVQGIPADPLPQSFRDLPPVEFVRAAEGLDAAYQPQITGRLWLPVETRRPVQVEVIVNFGHSEEFTVPNVQVYDPWQAGRAMRRRTSSPRNRGAPDVERTFAMAIEALKPLTNLELRNGSLRIVGLDLARRRLVFEQDLSQPLDWPRLRDSLSSFSSSVVSAETLSGQKENPQFFRDFLEEELRTSPAVREQDHSSTVLAGGAGSGQEPMRVFIVLSSAMLFARGSAIPRVTPPEGCRCRFYHVRLHLLGNIWDQVADILEPLDPQRFEIHSPMDYRRALSVILQDLKKN